MSALFMDNKSFMDKKSLIFPLRLFMILYQFEWIQSKLLMFKNHRFNNKLHLVFLLMSFA